jgi:nucleotide-binding universal stress UspA family protein
MRLRVRERHDRRDHNQEEEMPDGPVLICYDGSDGARRAIGAAAELLGPRKALVVDIGSPVTPAESLAVLSPVAPAAAFAELNADDARDRAREGAELARQAGFVPDARGVVEAPTWQGIVDAANEVDAAVIVVGSRGLDAAQEILKGSVSHQIAEHAGRPVLIVPPA